ncbi:uncharacterized protein CTRU02_206901 [Colletotrichum truncatum]|uniref:Uncharacterized protein n=1 Tax=Colletotrichum truncatum TaxID=5467 RepID=A0ACC3YZ04_COLTU|nr:uncharacterized protein CTRU02_15396 [Colletotrichum truncatum]KAF6781116.1 hypothetical protein CTRU02_15396 [Colletotrichum truncatum]
MLLQKEISNSRISATFTIKVRDFFESYQRGWVWMQLRLLTLTSRILTRRGNLKCI